MSKFGESELVENLKGFQNKETIELEFEKSIEGKVKLEEATVSYDNKKGYINIESKNCNFRINTTLVWGYEKNKNGISIDLDTMMLNLKKI